MAAAREDASEEMVGARVEVGATSNNNNDRRGSSGNGGGDDDDDDAPVRAVRLADGSVRHGRGRTRHKGAPVGRALTRRGASATGRVRVRRRRPGPGDGRGAGRCLSRGARAAGAARAPDAVVQHRARWVGIDIRRAPRASSSMLTRDVPRAVRPPRGRSTHAARAHRGVLCERRHRIVLWVQRQLLRARARPGRAGPSTGP